MLSVSFWHCGNNVILLKEMIFLQSASEGWGRVIFSVCLSVHTQRYTSPGWEEVPQSWLGGRHPGWYCGIPWPGLGYPRPQLVRTGIPRRQGLGTPWSGLSTTLARTGVPLSSQLVRTGVPRRKGLGTPWSGLSTPQARTGYPLPAKTGLSPVVEMGYPPGQVCLLWFPAGRRFCC